MQIPISPELYERLRQIELARQSYCWLHQVLAIANKHPAQADEHLYAEADKILRTSDKEGTEDLDSLLMVNDQLEKQLMEHPRRQKAVEEWAPPTLPS